MRLAILLALIIVVPIVPEPRSAAATEIGYVGTLTEGSFAYDVSLNVSLSIDVNVPTMTYVANYSYSIGDYSNSGAYSASGNYFDFAYVPLEGFAVPVALNASYLGDMLNAYYMRTLVYEPDELSVSVEFYNGTVEIDVTAGYLETVRVDPETGIVVYYYINTGDSSLELRASAAPSAEPEAASGSFKRILETPARASTLAIELEKLYIGPSELVEFDYTYLFNGTIYSGKLVTGASGRSPLPTLIFPVRTLGMEFPTIATTTPAGEEYVGYGTFEFEGHEIYLGVFPDGRVMSLYFPHEFIALAAYGDAPMVYADGLTIHADAEIEVTQRGELVLSGSGSVTLPGYDEYRVVVTSEGGVANLFVPSMVPRNPEGSVSGDFEVLVYDDEPFVRYELNASEGLMPAYIPVTLPPGELRVTDLQGHSISLAEAPKLSVTYELSDGTLSIRGSISDDDEEFVVTIYVDGSPARNSTVGREFSASLALSPGGHVIRVVARDPTGLGDSVEFNATVAESGGSRGSEEPGGVPRVPVAVVAAIIALLAVLAVVLRRRDFLRSNAAK